VNFVRDILDCNINHGCVVVPHWHLRKKARIRNLQTFIENGLQPFAEMQAAKRPKLIQDWQMPGDALGWVAL
jgi:hypothetical protein